EITPQSQHQLLSVDEWMTILGAFHQVGVKAVRLTGGEPLLYPHIEELLARIKQTGWFEDISMTTNGSLLAPRAEKLKELGLNRVNISLDSLDSDAFALCVGKADQLDSVLSGIQSAIDAGFTSVKINTVLSRHWTDDEVRALLTYVETWPVIWRFIEYMPFQGDAFHGPTFDEWKAQLERVSGGILTENHGVYGFGPATYYNLPSGKEIGFIFSMSHSYCDTCNRVRLTSDGQMRLCLLRDDEADLVSLVRRGLSETELASHIEWALQRKQERHDGVTMDQPERPMWRIGG
ncbi:MAG: radical SAM protein, partial [Veillonella sp.]|nr:radical SAM protein [Veillonella sp.]